MSEKFPHAYICPECAYVMGLVWPEGHEATFSYSKCNYCGKNVPTCAVTDWDEPGGRKRSPLERD